PALPRGEREAPPERGRGGLIADPYITYEALGLAIILTLGKDDETRRRVNRYLPEGLRGVEHTRSVVLIDEVDKAPRDLPNDILNEIEQMTFEVKELDAPPFEADQRYRPIIVLTSNSEKNLPDAFLRRCVFYHIAFPNRDRLKEIIQRRLRLDSAFTPQMLDNAILHFEKIRDLTLKKKPATAELLAWIRVLEKRHLDVSRLKPGEAEALAFTYSILAKSREDQEMIVQNLQR
ncbi:MAG TPA: hypothetical protein VEQ40_09490, partial [Pyrinomonadaceae bacterium]|nr:hypothetical protein [Pyrinomonadaceae bacterium]